MLSSDALVHEMRGTQFPFGVLKVEQHQIRKAFIKKRYYFRDQQEYQHLQQKIDKLKTIQHKNTINLRSAEENGNSITLIYQYVPHSIEDSFVQNPNQTVKDMHRQFIELAIYLAKNSIATTFNYLRCGIVINQNHSSIIKYFLPLNDITITNNRTMLERSVQLFNVHSMHYLDNLVNQDNIQQSLNNTINQSSSQRTFKNRVKLFPNRNDKHRRDSQPTGFFPPKDRKFSNIPKLQDRKLSSLSRELSEISQIHKRNRTSTRGSGGSFNTFQSILSLRSQREPSRCKSTQSQFHKLGLKRCLSQKGLEEVAKVENVIGRSKRALMNLQKVKQNMHSYKGLYAVIRRLQTTSE